MDEVTVAREEAVVIPAPYRPILKALLDLPPGAADGFVSTLDNTVPPVASRNQIIDIATQLLPSLDAVLLVDALLSIYSSKGDRSVGEVSIDIARTRTLEIPQDRQDHFAERLRAFLSVKVIANLGRALDIAYEHGLVFASVRIFSDVRPLFVDGPDRSPTGAVIGHTLKLDVVNNGNYESIYIALDTIDLESLRDVLAREVTKTTTLQGVLAQLDLPCIDPGGQ
jgi:hypothetical protein